MSSEAEPRECGEGPVGRSVFGRRTGLRQEAAVVSGKERRILYKDVATNSRLSQEPLGVSSFLVTPASRLRGLWAISATKRPTHTRPAELELHGPFE